MEMKNIFKYAVIATALSAGIFSCSEDEFAKDEQNSQIVSVGGLKIQVGDFPSESLRSSVPGFEAGKSAWENGDQIKLVIKYNNAVEPKTYLIEYQNGWDLSQVAGLPTSASTIDLVAEYSSDRSYKANGVSEYFKYTYSGSASQSITISFTRNYSRLRVFAGEDVKLVTLKSKSKEFFLNGGTEKAESLTLNSENIKNFDGVYVNNVYFYGTWAEGTVLDINGKEFTMDESVPGKSYAIDLQHSGKVEVDCGVITLHPDSKLRYEHVVAAICPGVSTLKFKGQVSSVDDLVDVIGICQEHSGTWMDNNLSLDMSELKIGEDEDNPEEDVFWPGSSSIMIEDLNKLILPKDISGFGAKALLLYGLKELHILHEGEIIYSTSSKKSMVLMDDCKLVLGAGVVDQRGSGDYWFGVVWRNIEILP